MQQWGIFLFYFIFVSYERCVRSHAHLSLCVEIRFDGVALHALTPLGVATVTPARVVAHSQKGRRQGIGVGSVGSTGGKRSPGSVSVALHGRVMLRSARKIVYKSSVAMLFCRQKTAAFCFLEAKARWRCVRTPAHLVIVL